MRTKKSFFLSVLAFILMGMLGSCTEIEIVTPKGPKGDEGKSAYLVWKEAVLDGTIQWPNDEVAVVDFFKYLKGEKGDNGKDGIDGKSAYEVWKEYIAAGTIANPHDPTQIWDGKNNSQADFWYFLTGATGENGKTPEVGVNGNWFIGGVDTGIPARGKDGKDGQDGQDGQDGKDGSVVIIGTNGNWFIDGVDTGVPARGKDGKDGQDGKDGKDGSVVIIGANGNWFIDGVDTGVPARGKDGTNGKTPEIGANGNWFIDGTDTGIPARGKDGKDGKDGQDGTNGSNGKSAYELWVEELTTKCGTADQLIDNKTGLPWDCSANTLTDFWDFLRGADGADGEDGKDGEAGATVVVGKPNVLATYYNGALKEYVSPIDGSVVFQVFDKTGAKVGAGVTVKGLPGMDANLSFTTDSEGKFKVSANQLPENKAIGERKGATTAVTIDGTTEAGAPNTEVPNRVHVRLTAEFVYLSQYGVGNMNYAGLNPNSNNKCFTVIQYKTERQIDGVWSDYPDTYPAPEVESVFVKDHTKPVTAANVESSAYHKSRGFITSSNEFTPPQKGIYLIIRPIVLTESEKNGTQYTPEALSAFSGYASNVKYLKENEWKNKDEYYTLKGIKNTYGEQPLITQAIHIPEIYPAPPFKYAKIEVKTGETNLWGHFDNENLDPIYLKYNNPGNTTDPWKSPKQDPSILKTAPLNSQVRTLIYITKNQGSTNGSSSTSCYWNKANTPEFKLYSSFPKNLYSSALSMNDGQGINSHGAKDPRITATHLSLYRTVAYYYLVESGGNYTFKDPFGVKADIPVQKEISPTDWGK